MATLNAGDCMELDKICCSIGNSS